MVVVCWSLVVGYRFVGADVGGVVIVVGVGVGAGVAIVAVAARCCKCCCLLVVCSVLAVG